MIIINNRSFLPIDGTLKGTTTSGQRVPGSNDKKGIFHILHISKARASQ